MSFRKFLWLLPVILSVSLLAGCSTTGTFVRMTPEVQPRNDSNLYHVEVTFHSSRQALRWETVQGYVIVDGKVFPLQPVPIVQNRWEGFVPVPATQDAVSYRFKFTYLYNVMGATPQPGSELSPIYHLKIINP